MLSDYNLTQLTTIKKVHTFIPYIVIYMAETILRLSEITFGY